MILYRYVLKDQNIGILVALDSIFNLDDKCDVDILFNLSAIFEDDLKVPNINMTNTNSWFTEKGNRHFSKAIRAIKKEYNNHGVEVVRLSLDMNTIPAKYLLYSDEYQVIISNEYKLD